jgi:hypothetical protein
VNVDVDKLGSERAAEYRAEVARLQAERDLRARVVHLELLDVEGSRMEVSRRRIGIVAGAVVVTCRVRDVEQLGSRHEVEQHRPGRMSGCAGRADGDDVEHARAAGDDDRDAEGAAGGCGHRRAVVVAELASVSSPRRWCCCGPVVPLTTTAT